MVDVQRPVGIPLLIMRRVVPSGEPAIIIRVGLTQVHQCLAGTARESH